MNLYIGKSNQIICFWTRMGSLITDRTVCTELGDKIYDNKNTTWFLSGLGTVIGFCCAEDTGKLIRFKHDYIIPRMRGKGGYNVLFNKRLKLYPGRSLEIVTKTPAVLHTVLKHGFYKHSERGTYSILRRD